MSPSSQPPISLGNAYYGCSLAPLLGGRSKRIFDICFTLLALFVSVVLLVFLAILLRLSSKGPILFSHKRVGIGGREFECLKFRTMVVDANAVLAEHLASNEDARREFAQYQKLKKDPRIIGLVGNLLRKSSLDELPQFFNVLRGDMSVVGPRPVTLEEFVHYGEHRSQMITCRPGITGLWQVSGRNELSFEERVSIDAAYMSNWSLRFDFQIILKTISTLLTRHGAY